MSKSGLRFLFLTTALSLPFLLHCGGDDSGQPADAGAPDASDAAAATVDASADAAEAGTPAASFPSDPLDFGLVDCGGAAPAGKTLTIANTGTAPLRWSAQLDNKQAFFLLGNTSGNIAPGATATITVSADAIVPSTVAGTAEAATLTITTNDPQHGTTGIPIKQTAAGATLSMMPSVGAAFGPVPAGTQAQDIPITLQNTGNKPVTLNFMAPVDAEFAVVWTGAPQNVTVAPGGSVGGLKARYKPAGPTAAISNAPLVVSGALCATTLQAISLSGQGTAGSFAASPAAIDFGLVNCGTTSTLAANMRTVTITNPGNAAYTWNAALGRGAGSPFTLTKTNTTVAPNGAAGTIVVTPKAIPQTSAVTPDLYDDTITITTDITQDAPHTVAITESAQGAILAFLPQAPIAFGGVPLTTSSTAQFNVTNVGNLAATVTLAATNGPVFTLSQPAVGQTNPGDVILETATFAPAAATANQTSSITTTLGPTDVSCGPLPTLAMSGDGTTGVASLSASSLDFGLVDCGKAANAKTINVINSGSAAFNLTDVQLAVGTSYVIVSPTMFPVSIPAMSSTPVTVRPNAIPATSEVTPDLYADTLTITTDAPSDQPHVVPIHMTAHGAILSASTTDVAFGGVPINTTARSQLSISNAGNAAAVVSFSNVLSQYVLSPQGASVRGGSGELVTTAFRPVQTQSYSDSAQVTVAAGTALCGALPAAIALSGQGTNGVAVVSPSSLDFGLVACSSVAQPQSITIQNNGSATFTWTATPDTNATNDYQLSATTGSVDPGNADTLVVTPNAIPASSLTTNDLYAGSITITTSGATGDSPHVVSLHETAFGARLALSVSQLTFPDTTVGAASSLPFTITNGGNGTANLTYSGFTNPPFDAEPSLVPLNGGTNVDITMTFSPQAIGPVSGQTFSLQLTDALCLPLPAPMNLNGSGK